MSGTNQRTWQQYRTGHFLCTVQLDPLADQRNSHGQKELASVARQLIGQMDAHRLPATWAVSDPAYSAATAIVMRSAVNHELAVLGDEHWVGPTAGRTRFARELARRVLQARTAGLRIATLVPRVATVERHIDLLVKQRITAVSGVVPIQKSRCNSLPRALHYGVWELPVAARLPIEANWLFSGKWSTWRQIRRAARHASTFHLTIDVPELSQEGTRAENTVAWLLRKVAELRDRGLINVETLAGASNRLAAVPSAAPQHSILRRAA
jgi:hypothetical protein